MRIQCAIKNKAPLLRGAPFYLGWLMGLEPTTTGITILGDNQALARLGAEFVGNIA